MFNSSSPHNPSANNSANSNFNRIGSGPGPSNPSSVKHNSTKQTVTSDILMATEQSSIKQRDNIKVFSFKPGNLKVQAKQLNVSSLKTSQINLNKNDSKV